MRKYRCVERGFTLIEVIAVMIILGLMAGIVTVSVNKQMEKAKKKATVTQISGLSQAISTFHLDCGFYPDSLDSLVRAPQAGRQCKGYPAGGYLEKKEIPSDPWENSYNFVAPGAHNTDGYDLWSNGPDGEDGTSDDITNWASESAEGE